MRFYVYLVYNEEDMYGYIGPGRVQPYSSENILNLVLECNAYIFAWLQVSQTKIRYWEIHFEIHLIGIYIMLRHISRIKKFVS